MKTISKIILILLISSTFSLKSLNQKAFNYQDLIKPDNDEDLNLDHKVPKINRHELYGEVKRKHRRKKDMVILFYHPMCPHCHEFLPKYQNVVANLTTKEKPQIDFFTGDCGLNPHFIAAFGIDYFPYLVYFHNGIPFEKMPPAFTQAEFLTKKWLLKMRNQYRNYKIGDKILSGTKMKNERQFFKQFLKILRKQLFSNIKLDLRSPKDIKNYLGRKAHKEIDNLKTKKKMKIGKKVKHVDLDMEDF